MLNKSSARGVKQNSIGSVPLQEHGASLAGLDTGQEGFARCPCNAGISAAFLAEKAAKAEKAFFFFVFLRLQHTWRRERAVRAPAPPPLGAKAKSPSARGVAFRFIKFIEFFTNGWTQFPPNFLIMQIRQISNLAQLGRATAPNSPAPARAAEKPRIMTPLIGNICDRYNKFSSQITFHPREPRAPVKHYGGLISLT